MWESPLDPSSSNPTSLRIKLAAPSAATRSGGRTARITRKVEEVIVQILLEKGYDGLTFKEVAESAGVNRSTLCRRWPNRAAMVLAAIKRIVQTHVVFEDTGSLIGDLRAVLRRIGSFIRSQGLAASGLRCRGCLCDAGWGSLLPPDRDAWKSR